MTSRPKCIVLIHAIIILFLSVTQFAACGITFANADIETIRLGNVSTVDVVSIGDESPEILWEIENTTGVALKVLGTSVGCGCSRIALDKTELSPGEVLRVRIFTTLDGSKINERGIGGTTFEAAVALIEVTGVPESTRFVASSIFRVLNLPLLEWDYLERSFDETGSPEVGFRLLDRRGKAWQNPVVLIESGDWKASASVGSNDEGVLEFKISLEPESEIDWGKTYDLRCTVFASCIDSQIKQKVTSEILRITPRRSVSFAPAQMYLNSNGGELCVISSNTAVEIMNIRLKGAKEAHDELKVTKVTPRFYRIFLLPELVTKFLDGANRLTILAETTTGEVELRVPVFLED